MKVQLLTREGKFVADKLIPPFNAWPEVVLWGERVFVFFTNQVGTDVGQYREAFAVAIVEPSDS